MGKNSRTAVAKAQEPSEQASSLFGSAAKVDPALASLFAPNTASQTQAKAKSSSKSDHLPIKKQTVHEPSSSDSEEVEASEESTSDHTDSEAEDEDSSSVSAEDDEESASEAEAAEVEESTAANLLADSAADSAKSRRKRKRDNDDLESKYMQQLEREEAREEAKRQGERDAKKPKTSPPATNGHEKSEASNSESDEDMAEAGSDDDEDFHIPQHESLVKTQDPEVEKANRTVFLGNVSSDAITDKTAEKKLKQHMASFLEALPKGDVAHKVESIRFRSTAYTNQLPKKASFVTQDLMDSTTKSTNAYVVYSTKEAARAALKLNGTVILGRHLRVDSVAHPAKSDPKRCVFVGGLAFVDDMSAIEAAEAEKGDKKKKPRKKAPSDIEEGLWQVFAKCGTVENVRVIRDSKTRVGKGIAYVQFTDENAVEAALLYDGKKFPPMLPRNLRVQRAKGMKRNAKDKDSRSRPSSNGVYNPKISDEQRSAMGRAGKLLGKAGAAMSIKPDAPASRPKVSDRIASIRGPESFVFEGHRATKGSASGGRKKVMKSSKKKSGRPNNHATRRTKAWKTGGGS